MLTCWVMPFQGQDGFTASVCLLRHMGATALLDFKPRQIGSFLCLAADSLNALRF